MKKYRDVHNRYMREMVGILLCFAVVACVRLYGGYRGGKTVAVKTERQFDRAMRHVELAVIMFYEKDKRMSRSNKSMWRAMDQLERMFGSVGKTSRYREAGVRFILVNASRGDLDNMFYEYHIKNIPTIMLFENGRPVKHKHRDDSRVLSKARRTRESREPIVELTGDISADQLRDFIEEYLGSRIDHIIEDKAEARRWAAENNLYAWPYRGWGPYYYWNYPYYGYYGPWWY